MIWNGNELRVLIFHRNVEKVIQNLKSGNISFLCHLYAYQGGSCQTNSRSPYFAQQMKSAISMYKVKCTIIG